MNTNLNLKIDKILSRLCAYCVLISWKQTFGWNKKLVELLRLSDKNQTFSKKFFYKISIKIKNIMNERDYKSLMNELRQLYLDRNFKELKRKYLLSRWMLTPEDREKIDKVVFVEVNKELSILEYAQKEMGGTLY
jgi:hypothetical protein